jgi:hypothetical protein
LTTFGDFSGERGNPGNLQSRWEMARPRIVAQRFGSGTHSDSAAFCRAAQSDSRDCARMGNQLRAVTGCFTASLAEPDDRSPLCLPSRPSGTLCFEFRVSALSKSIVICVVLARECVKACRKEKEGQGTTEWTDTHPKKRAKKTRFQQTVGMNVLN